jgi:hypothetical protein
LAVTSYLKTTLIFYGGVTSFMVDLRPYDPAFVKFYLPWLQHWSFESESGKTNSKLKKVDNIVSNIGLGRCGATATSRVR